jgi:hypothetical protein
VVVCSLGEFIPISVSRGEGAREEDRAQEDRRKKETGLKLEGVGHSLNMSPEMVKNGLQRGSDSR